MSCGWAFHKHRLETLTYDMFSWQVVPNVHRQQQLARDKVQSRNTVSHTSLQCKLEPCRVGSCGPTCTAWSAFFVRLATSVVHLEWKTWSEQIFFYEKYPVQILSGSAKAFGDVLHQHLANLYCSSSVCCAQTHERVAVQSRRSVTYERYEFVWVGKSHGWWFHESVLPSSAQRSVL